jgi:hypothetical protein
VGRGGERPWRRSRDFNGLGAKTCHVARHGSFASRSMSAPQDGRLSHRGGADLVQMGSKVCCRRKADIRDCVRGRLNWPGTAPSEVASGTTGVGAQAVIPLRGRMAFANRSGHRQARRQSSTLWPRFANWCRMQGIAGCGSSRSSTFLGTRWRCYGLICAEDAENFGASRERPRYACHLFSDY